MALAPLYTCKEAINKLYGNKDKSEFDGSKESFSIDKLPLMVLRNRTLLTSHVIVDRSSVPYES